MNIFYLGYSLDRSSGGIENYTFTVLDYLQQQGHNIYVYTVKDETKKFKTISLRKNKYIDKLLIGRRLAKKLKDNKIEIDLFLCGHLFLAKHMEEIVRKDNNIYNLFVYGIDCWAGKFKQKAKKFKHLDKVISISSFTSEQIIKQGFKNEIVYLPPVIDKSIFPNINIKKKDNIIRFITVGRLSSEEQYKGHDKVI